MHSAEVHLDVVLSVLPDVLVEGVVQGAGGLENGAVREVVRVRGPRGAHADGVVAAGRRCDELEHQKNVGKA